MTGSLPAVAPPATEPRAAPASAYSRDRLVALSDGVFSIALTLLVLELVPRIDEAVTGRELVGALLGMWPELVAYLLSFLVIGRFWDAHRGLFRVVPLADNRVVWANLAVLLWVTLIPATAALLGAHWLEPAALVLYAADLLLATASLWGLWRYASSAGYLRREGLPVQTGHSVDRYCAVSVAGYALVLPAAFLSPPVALVLVFLTTALARVLARRVLAPAAPPAPGAVAGPPGRDPGLVDADA
jgi:uncharacterized membrane protein